MKCLFVSIVVASVLFVACGAKKTAPAEESYLFTGNSNEFIASVVSEKNDDGSESWYFALDGYRLIRSSKEEAISYFNDFKETWENEEKEYGEGAGGRIIMLEKEKLDLMTVRTKTIRYADLDANPNYAEPDM